MSGANDLGNTVELPPSRLGTKSHWDDVYRTELANFHEIGDEGEVWFGEESIDKIVRWVAEIPDPSPQAVLEIGSGNGTLLLSLVEEIHPPPRVLGIDYSADAVSLSRDVARGRDLSEDAIVEFEICDFLNDDVPVPAAFREADPNWSGWELVLDKGTYDAIALGEKNESGESPVLHYPARLASLLRPGGYFLITSCNFTEDELKTAFANEKTGLKYHSRIQHRTFTFGGQSGNVVSSVAFQKNL